MNETRMIGLKARLVDGTDAGRITEVVTGEPSSEIAHEVINVLRGLDGARKANATEVDVG